MADTGLISKQITCEGRLGWLCDTLQPYSTYTVSDARSALQMFINTHNFHVEEDRQFEVGQVTVTASNDYNYVRNWDTTFQTISDKLINNFGGELQVRDGDDGKVYLDWLDRIGQGTDTKIELAVNLKSVTRTIDETSVVTRFFPLGAKLDNSEDRVRITSVNSGKSYLDDEELIAKYGVIVGCYTWDDVTLPSNLLTKGKEYFKQMNKAKIQYTVTALDLSTIGMDFEEFELGNTYRLVNPLMGIDDDLRIIGISYNLDSPQLSELTFGDKFETMTGLTAKKSKSFATQIEESNFRNMSVINSKIENATALITGAQGGHVILDPSEKPSRILVMDTENIDTCTSCIQLNKNGLGFWNKAKNGGSAKEGPYTNAWTIDGNLVASFITALTLTGLKINNGSGTFSVDEDGKVIAKAIEILGGSIQVETDKETNDIIKLSCGDWTLQLSPLEVRVDNSTIGGHFVIQAGALSAYWNDELKINLDSNSGNISTYTNSGKPVFSVDTNNRQVYVYDSDEKITVQLDGTTGSIYCKQVFQSGVTAE
jgi:phage minor structural protein